MKTKINLGLVKQKAPALSGGFFFLWAARLGHLAQDFKIGFGQNNTVAHPLP